MYDEMDILKEVGGTAAAHASIALSDILGRTIKLSVPAVQIVPCGNLESICDFERMGMAVSSKFLTTLKGELAFVLDEKNFFKIIDLSYKISRDDKKPGAFTEMGMSLIKEVGSIVTGAYTSALSMMLKNMILLSTPTLVSGLLHEVLSLVLFSNHNRADDNIILIKNIFEEVDEKISGVFYLVLTPQTAEKIREICKSILKELE